MSQARRDLLVAVVIAVVVTAALYAMTRVFVSDDWMAPTVAAVGLSVALAAAARRVRLPSVGALLLSLVGLVVFVYVVHLPAGPLIPGRAELEAARALFREGMVALREQPAPTEPLPELTYLVTLAAWVVGFVAHELAVRLHRPGIALIAPAALWVVPLSMPQPTPATARTAVGFLLASALLLLLESDADLTGWARERIAPRITVAGSVLAIGAVGLGVLAPGLLPGYGAPPVLDVGGSSDPRGYQPIVDIGDRLTLPSERPVLRVASERRVYLRLAALDTYDANTWRLGPPGSSSFVPDETELYPGDEQLPFETPIATAETSVIDVEVLDLENIYVPVPYQPVQVNGGAAGDMVWSRIGGFLATGELAENELGGTLRTGVVPGLRYQVVSAIPDPTIAQLRESQPDPAAVEPWLRLPGGEGRWDRFAEQAQQVYEERGADTAVDRALALQTWFTSSGGFTYALDDIEPLRGPNPLESFVFDTRTGYCEYYATAMAVMLRATGVPARVAVGFLPGEQVVPPDPAGGEPRAIYEVSTADAHSWVEVLFPGQGWIKFDPTPRSDGATLPPDEQDLDPQLAPDEAADLLGPTPEPSPPAPSEQPAPFDPGAVADPQQEPTSTPLLPRVLGGLLALVAVAAGVTVLRRREAEALDDRAAVLRARRRVLHAAASLGDGRRDAETAAQALHRWASDGRCDPSAAAELAVLGQRAAFAPPGTPVDRTRASELADQLVAQLRDRADATARALAPVRVPALQVLTKGRDLLDAVRDRVGP